MLFRNISEYFEIFVGKNLFSKKIADVWRFRVESVARHFAEYTVNLSFSTPDRDRPVTKLRSQISHAKRTLFTVPFLNKSTGLKLTINVSLIASKNI